MAGPIGPYIGPYSYEKTGRRFTARRHGLHMCRQLAVQCDNLYAVARLFHQFAPFQIECVFRC